MYEWFQCPFCNLFWFFSPAIWICFQTSVCLCEPMWGECADRDHSRSHYQRLQPINVKEMGPTRHSNTNIPENNCSQYNVHQNQNLFFIKSWLSLWPKFLWYTCICIYTIWKWNTHFVRLCWFFDTNSYHFC